MRYTLEDFLGGLGRLKEFASYYCRNFFFGHELHRRCLGARTDAPPPSNSPFRPQLSA